MIVSQHPPTSQVHNDHDAACINWWGDRRPDPDDRVNRDFGGDSTPIWERRCLVCRPYSEAEADALLINA